MRDRWNLIVLCLNLLESQKVELPFEWTRQVFLGERILWGIVYTKYHVASNLICTGAFPLFRYAEAENEQQPQLATDWETTWLYNDWSLEQRRHLLVLQTSNRVESKKWTTSAGRWIKEDKWTIVKQCTIIKTQLKTQWLGHSHSFSRTKYQYNEIVIGLGNMELFYQLYT